MARKAAKDVFHNHAHPPPHQNPIHNGHSPKQNHNDLGSQFLNFIKMAIFIFFIFKIIQLVFLKYRRKLSLPERVERKYRYSHSQIINNYSDTEIIQMNKTIQNTIKNAQVECGTHKKKSKGMSRRVSFEVEKNVYHDFRKNKSEEFHDADEQNSLFSKVKFKDQVQEINIYQEKNQKGEKLTNNKNNKDVQLSIISQTSELEASGQSKLTFSTEASNIQDSQIFINNKKTNSNSPVKSPKTTNKSK